MVSDRFIPGTPREAQPGSIAKFAQSDGEDEVALLDLLTVLAEHKKVVLGVTFSVAILAALVSLFLPVRYTATATIVAPQQNESFSSLFAAQAQAASTRNLSSLFGGAAAMSFPKTQKDLYTALLKSRTVEDAMIRRFDLMREYKQTRLSDCRAVFERKATVDPGGKEGWLYISVVDRDPERAAELTNGYVEELSKLAQELAVTEASQRRILYERQLAGARADLLTSEQAYQQSQQISGIIHQGGQSIALTELARKLFVQMAAKQSQIQSLRTYASEGNPELVQAEAELAALRDESAALSKSTGTDADDTLISKAQLLNAGVENQHMQSDLRRNGAQVEFLSRQLEAARLDEAKKGKAIQVIDPAVPPERRSFPKRGMIVIASTVAGFFAGIIAALICSAYKLRREFPQTLWRFTRLRELLFPRRFNIAARHS
jgi:tyrosine-protein kinase Etk/Wzc